LQWFILKSAEEYKEKDYARVAQEIKELEEQTNRHDAEKERLRQLKRERVNLHTILSSQIKALKGLLIRTGIARAPMPPGMAGIERGGYEVVALDYWEWYLGSHIKGLRRRPTELVPSSDPKVDQCLVSANTV
jgi:transposase